MDEARGLAEADAWLSHDLRPRFGRTLVLTSLEWILKIFFPKACISRQHLDQPHAVLQGCFQSER